MTKTLFKTSPTAKDKAAMRDSAKPLDVAKPAIKTAPAKIAGDEPFDARGKPLRFTYALAAYTGERRPDGWWVCRTPVKSAGDKPRWSGPFATIETACLSIARHLAVEIADRHTRSIEWHKLKPTDPLYGLKPTTRLKPGKSKPTDSVG